jgi:hypothetical protein
MRQHDERDLRTALREEADRHRPDRAVMLDRIGRARAEPAARRPVERFLALLRPAAAALAVAVVLVLAVAGVRLSNRGPEVDDTPAAPPTVVPTTPAAPTGTTAAPKPSTKGTTTTTDPTSKPATKGTPGKTTPPRSTTPAATAQTDADGYLTSAAWLDPGSNDSWSQDTLELKSTRTITALDITIKVARTPGVVETGRWSTVAPELLTITTSSSNAELTFHFTLHQGATLPAGSYTFAVQFNHAAGERSAADDNYTARVTGDDKDAKVSGAFTAQ